MDFLFCLDYMFLMYIAAYHSVTQVEIAAYTMIHHTMLLWYNLNIYTVNINGSSGKYILLLLYWGMFFTLNNAQKSEQGVHLAQTETFTHRFCIFQHLNASRIYVPRNILWCETTTCGAMILPEPTLKYAIQIRTKVSDWYFQNRPCNTLSRYV